MTDEDYEFYLTDRIAKIQAIQEQLDLKNNGYISFSGGKDSTVLHYLIDMALPGNNIPRIYINTGMDYRYIIQYVKKLASSDNRIIIVNAGVKIKKMLEEEGYPFKSKIFSVKHNLFERIGKSKSVRAFLNEERTKTGIMNGGSFKCPDELKYMFTPEFNRFKISSNCCLRLKKDTIHKWQSANNKTIGITGLRRSEGASRINVPCLASHNTLFHPLSPLKDDFIKEFVEREKITLCKLYYPPYNFTRTGCKGCPFSKELQKNLDNMYKLLPNEYKQCLFLWKPVYDEYIRAGYRLKEYPHNIIDKKVTKLF